VSQPDDEELPAARLGARADRSAERMDKATQIAACLLVIRRHLPPGDAPLRTGQDERPPGLLRLGLLFVRRDRIGLGLVDGAGRVLGRRVDRVEP